MKKKSGYAVITGEPNAGKSTLLNAILGQNLSIVTPKPQTTRYRTPGIYTRGDVQIIFIDTPGILEPKYKLQHFMKKEIDSSLIEADVILLLVDASKYDTADLRELYDSYQKEFSRHKVFCVLNKIDLITNEHVLMIIDDVSKKFSFCEIVPVSAFSGFNVDELIRTIVKYIPEHEFYYGSDTVTTQSERFFVGEIIRESALFLYGEEVPYSVHVEIDEFKEREAGKDFIRASIILEKDSQKKIMIGSGGSMIKKLGEKARKEIEEFLHRPVYLELRVKVSKSWKNDEAFLKRKFNAST